MGMTHRISATKTIEPVRMATCTRKLTVFTGTVKFTADLTLTGIFARVPEWGWYECTTDEGGLVLGNCLPF